MYLPFSMSKRLQTTASPARAKVWGARMGWLVLTAMTLTLMGVAQAAEAESSAEPVRVIRVAVLASNRQAISFDAGYHVRWKFFMPYLHDVVQDGVQFQFFQHSCHRHDGSLAGLVCDSVDIIFHTKRMCPVPLELCTKQAHVLELQDQLMATDKSPKMATLYKRIDGEAFMTNVGVKKFCKAKFCMKLPMVFDLLRCENVVQRAQEKRKNLPINRLVGIVGNAKAYGTILETLDAANISYVRETRCKGNVECSCKFFSSITHAIAWSPFIVTKEALSGDYRKSIISQAGAIKHEDIKDWYIIKPAERFFNPMLLNIPTVGFSKYVALQEFGDNFLCETDQCVLDLLNRIDNGELVDAMTDIQRKMRRAVDAKRMAQVVRTFFIDVLAWKRQQLSNGVPNTTMSILNGEADQCYYNVE